MTTTGCSQNIMLNVIHFGKQILVVRKNPPKYWRDSQLFLLRLKTYIIFRLVFHGFELHFRIVMLILEFE
jgi:hypothetical protein